MAPIASTAEAASSGIRIMDRSPGTTARSSTLLRPPHSISITTRPPTITWPRTRSQAATDANRPHRCRSGHPLRPPEIPRSMANTRPDPPVRRAAIKLSHKVGAAIRHIRRPPVDIIPNLITRIIRNRYRICPARNEYEPQPNPRYRSPTIRTRCGITRRHRRPMRCHLLRILLQVRSTLYYYLM